MVLILVLVILMLVVAAALSLAREVSVEVTVARQRADAVLLRAMTASALERAMAEVRRDDTPEDTLFDAWRDDEVSFAGFAHGEEGSGGRIWYLLPSPDPGDGRELRYGIRDVASKLDVNAASREMLLALPGITDEAVDGIIDWRDEDDELSELGAESSYYNSLETPYEAKNGPIESLDELLRIKGIDAAMLYGEDRNQNGLLDPGEDDGDRSFPPDDADGELDRGLVDYLTLYARDLNRTADGRERLDYNGADPGELEARLGEAGLDGGVLNRVRLTKAQANEVSSLGELVVRVGSDDPAQVGILLDELKVGEEAMVAGRVNVNTASPEVLACLPGLEEDDLDAILTHRIDPSVDLSSPAWLLEVIPMAQFAPLVDLVTTRAWQFSVHIVALLDDRPRFRRVEALIDRSFVPVRVLTWRDLTPLGFPIPGERGEELP